jgi:hypothetical protein
MLAVYQSINQSINLSINPNKKKDWTSDPSLPASDLIVSDLIHPS